MKRRRDENRSRSETLLSEHCETLKKVKNDLNLRVYGDVFQDKNIAEIQCLQPISIHQLASFIKKLEKQSIRVETSITDEGLLKLEAYERVEAPPKEPQIEEPQSKTVEEYEKLVKRAFGLFLVSEKDRKCVFKKAKNDDTFEMSVNNVNVSTRLLSGIADMNRLMQSAVKSATLSTRKKNINFVFDLQSRDAEKTKLPADSAPKAF